MKPLQTLDVGGGNIFKLYDPDTDASAFDDYAPLVRLWQERRANRFLPAWSDFSFEDLTPWIGRFLLADLDFSDGIDGVYRLCGGVWVSVFNNDLTGKRYKDCMTEISRARSKPYFEILYRDNLIGYRITSSYWFQRDFMNVSVLDLPLSQDGNTISQCLSTVTILED